MKAIKRFRDGIFNPREVKNYVDDKKRFTALYFFILAFLILIPSLVSVIFTPIVTYETKKEIRESFYHEETVPFYINSNILFNYNHDSEYVFEKELSSTTLLIMKANDEVLAYSGYSTVIEFCRTGVFINQFGFRSLLFSYREYEELNNIKFNDAYINSSEFWEKIFNVAEKEVPKQEILYKGISIVALFISYCVELGLWSLILAIFNNSSNRLGISFGNFWQMVVYLITPYALGIMISEMFGISWVSFIGLVVTIINIMRFSSKIVIIKGDDSDEL